MIVSALCLVKQTLYKDNKTELLLNYFDFEDEINKEDITHIIEIKKLKIIIDTRNRLPEEVVKSRLKKLIKAIKNINCLTIQFDIFNFSSNIIKLNIIAKDFQNIIINCNGEYEDCVELIHSKSNQSNLTINDLNGTVNEKFYK